MTTAELCERVVKPMTRGGGGPEGTGQSYAELVGRREEEEEEDEEGSGVVDVVGDPPDGRGALIVGGVRHRRGRRWGGTVSKVAQGFISHAWAYPFFQLILAVEVSQSPPSLSLAPQADFSSPVLSPSFRSVCLSSVSFFSQYL